MNNNKIRLFVDFDGTITKKDVGDAIFERFLRPELLEQGWHEQIISEWIAGRLTSHECLSRECEQTIITEEELIAELNNFEISEGFTETAHYCKNNGIPLLVLSDGLDYYIKYILEKHGLDDLEYRANHVYFSNGSLGIEFPYGDRGCGRCGNCKRWHIETTRQDGDCVIYAGDGYSDQYAIRSADVIFAKQDLAKYCDKENLDYFSYDNFFDILKHIKSDDGKV
ncbi:MAG: MtnX-like HAD-IB family phosphatase [Candidatus Latescibacteria bacterium]|jgi:2-hydroxy-3-keto-5-methylthiopentenyl-1-phosphate phosphatase|nr:MtnX-like HAD-IB family phosphatase [Candidatus Latescibacterota bacterium]